MKKYIAVVLMAIFMISCKSKAVAVQNSNSEVVSKTDNKVIEKHYDNKLNF